MSRVKFKQKNMQKFFLKSVLEKTGCPSIKELSNRFLEVPFSTWRNYFSELRLMPLDLFNELCEFAGIRKQDFEFELLGDTWGQVKGGKKRRY